jgi:hypothetical protein
MTSFTIIKVVPVYQLEKLQIEHSLYEHVARALTFLKHLSQMAIAKLLGGDDMRPNIPQFVLSAVYHDLADVREEIRI